MMLMFSVPAWPPALNAILNHLWQSTLFAALVALLTLALRNNHARWRSRLWLAASIKFLVPFSVLVSIGNRFGWHTAGPAAQPGVAYLIEEVGQAFVQPVVHRAVVTLPSTSINLMPAIALFLWLGGCAAVLFAWGLRWRRIQAVAHAGVPLTEGREWEALRLAQRNAGVNGPVLLLSSPNRLEPGVFGVFRPVLLWPAGISERLAGPQMEAVIAHEVCHIRRRDNLAAAIHMVVEAIFWFHPLVWWLGARLVDERENACDEEVLALGETPRVYAESILKTCQFCLESPLACMAGVTGSDLRQRIERIMTHRVARRLDRARKLLLAAAGVATVAVPVGFGVFTAPAVSAQAPAESKPSFEVASIKPNTSGDHRVSFRITPGRVAYTNVTAKILVSMAYNLKPGQLEGCPSWMDDEHYDVTAKADGVPDRDRMKLMVQSLLTDRFKLAFHHETKEMPIYSLVVGKNGPKLHPADASNGGKNQFRIGRGQIDLSGGTMANLADALSNLVDRTVLDRTGLSGNYDIKLEWTPDESEAHFFKGPPDGKPPAAAPPADAGPSVFTAVQEQLGLKLEAQKGPVEVTVIDHIEKASEN